MVIHYHHAIVPNSGFLKRMKNIDRDLVGLLGEKSVEVEFYPKSKREYVKTEGQFTLSPNVVKKYYVALTGNSKIDYFIRLFKLVGLLLRYRPSYIIGEASMQPKLIWAFRLFSPKTKVVFDIHGAVAEEVEYQGASMEQVAIERTVEGNSVRRVDFVVCQSDEMKRYIQSQYSVDGSKICIYRCGVDTALFNISNEARDSVRKDLGIDNDEKLFVYSGSMHPWQRIEDTIEMFFGYHNVNKSSKLLILTAECESLHQLMQKRGWNNDEGAIISMSVPFTEVPKYLNAADIAFLLRHNHVMNAVASPTKLAEYMACGLSVITSEVAKKWVPTMEYPYFFLEDNSISELDDFLNRQNRQMISGYAVKYLSLEVDRENVKSFFRNK